MTATMIIPMQTVNARDGPVIRSASYNKNADIQAGITAPPRLHETGISQISVDGWDMKRS
jgi:hypothetical protein